MLRILSCFSIVIIFLLDFDESINATSRFVRAIPAAALKSPNSPSSPSSSPNSPLPTSFSYSLPPPSTNTSQHTLYVPSSLREYYDNRDKPECQFQLPTQSYKKEQAEQCINQKRSEYLAKLPVITSEVELNNAVNGGYAAIIEPFKPSSCSPRRKIYDAIVFNDELPLLQIRINELYNIVDYFIIVESAISFSGLKKNLTFFDNRHLFAEFLPKIIHVICDLTTLTTIDESNDQRGWPREEASRDCTSYALTTFASSDDLIVQCDTDELPKPEVIHALRSCSAELTSIFPAYNHYENMALCGIRFLASYRWRDTAFNNWCGCRVGTVGQSRYSSLLNSGVGVNHIRRKMGTSIWLQESEWHCSSCFFGDVEMMKSKFKSWSEISVSKKFLDDPAYFDEMQKDCSKARYDGHRCSYYLNGYTALPMYVQLNVEKFKPYMPDLPWDKNGRKG